MLACSTDLDFFIQIIIATKKWIVIKTGEKSLGKKYTQINMSVWISNKSYLDKPDI